MSRVTRLVTAEELERLPDDDYRYELVDGRIIRMSPVGWQHGRVVARLMFLLMQHLEDAPGGVVLTEVGFKLTSSPDTVRAPDIAFVMRERAPAPGHRGYYEGPPDVAIEVLSPGDTAADMRGRIENYLDAGARLVLVVDPDRKRVMSCRPQRAPVTLRGLDARLDLGELVPGFGCTLAEVLGDL